jgi:hypothetical protein
MYAASSYRKDSHDVEQGITQSADDPLPILFVNPKDPEGFQPLLFLDRTLSHDQ